MTSILTARLVPGLQTPNRSGQHAYRHAFDEATIAEQTLQRRPRLQRLQHLLRKSCATDLAWTAGIEDAVRRRFMGHRAGEDVFGRIYTLDHPDVAPLAKVAEILDHNVAMSIGGLMTPTLHHVQWGTAHPIAPGPTTSTPLWLQRDGWSRPETPTIPFVMQGGSLRNWTSIPRPHDVGWPTERSRPLSHRTPRACHVATPNSLGSGNSGSVSLGKSFCLILRMNSASVITRPTTCCIAWESMSSKGQAREEWRVSTN